MEIYILRHGAAEDARPGHRDSERELTGEGRKKTEAVCKLARRAGIKPTLVLSSPYARALETARIAARELEYPGHLLTIDSLVPHSSPERVWADIRTHDDQDAILLAGHEPLLSHLVGYLLDAPSLKIEMKKSALVRIDIDAPGVHPRGALKWMLVPRLVS
jgi:phosphohistidine phosphatase